MTVSSGNYQHYIYIYYGTANCDIKVLIQTGQIWKHYFLSICLQ